MKASRDTVRVKIILSCTVKEADKIIEEHYDFKTYGEKIAFLKGMFDVKVVDVHDAPGTKKEESDKMTYFALLDHIIFAERF